MENRRYSTANAPTPQGEYLETPGKPVQPVYHFGLNDINNDLNQNLIQPSAPELLDAPPAQVTDSHTASIVYTSFYFFEISVLAFVIFSSSIFEYCYWEFGVLTYKKSADKDLTFGNTRGSVSELYSDLQCDVENPYQECPDLCEFAERLKKIKIVVFLGISAQVLISLLGLGRYISACLLDRPVGSRKVGIVYHFLSILTLSFCVILYVLFSGVFSLSDNEDDFELFSEYPEDLNPEPGVFILAGLVVYMIFYRLLLTILIKES